MKKNQTEGTIVDINYVMKARIGDVIAKLSSRYPISISNVSLNQLKILADKNNIRARSILFLLEKRKSFNIFEYPLQIVS